MLLLLGLEGMVSNLFSRDFAQIFHHQFQAVLLLPRLLMIRDNVVRVDKPAAAHVALNLVDVFLRQ